MPSGGAALGVRRRPWRPAPLPSGFPRACFSRQSATHWAALTDRSSFSQVQKSELEVLAGRPRLEISFWWWPPVLGVPWRSLAYSCTPPVSASRAFSPCVCLRMARHTGTAVPYTRAHPTPAGPHPNLIMSAKTLFPNKIAAPGLGFQPNCWGAQLTPLEVTSGLEGLLGRH